MDKTIVTYGLIIYQTYVILHTNTIANTKTHSKSAISNTKKKIYKSGILCQCRWEYRMSECGHNVIEMEIHTSNL